MKRTKYAVMTAMLALTVSMPAYAETYRFFNANANVTTEVSAAELEKQGLSAEEYAKQNGLVYVSTGNKINTKNSKVNPSGVTAADTKKSTDKMPGQPSESNSIVIISESAAAKEEESKESNESKESKESKNEEKETVKKKSAANRSDDEDDKPSKKKRVPEAKQETASPENEKKATISHGIYPGLTKTALDAFTVFSTNDINDDCYINVDISSSKKSMPADHIAYTKKNEEDGTIQFINSKKEIVYSVRFPQVESKNNEAVDLSIKAETDGNALKVHFEHPTDAVSVIFRIKTDFLDKDLYVYSGEDASERASIHSDRNGYAAISLSKLEDFVISPNENYKSTKLTSESDTDTGESYENTYSYSGDSNNSYEKYEHTETVEGVAKDATERTSTVKSAADGETYEMPETYADKTPEETRKLPVIPVVISIAALIAAVVGNVILYKKLW